MVLHGQLINGIDACKILHACTVNIIKKLEKEFGRETRKKLGNRYYKDS